MTALVFLDTKIALYLIDERELEKKRRVQEWIDWLLKRNNLIVSPQILNELYWMGRTRYPDMPTEDLQRFVSDFFPNCTAPLNAAVTRKAFGIERRYGLSWWDCLIVASALAARCRLLLTEEMQHGIRVDALTIVSPFLATPAEAVTEL